MQQGAFMNYYVHDVPGRLRVKIPTVKDRPNSGRQLKAFFDAMEGVDKVTVNTVTGSLVVRYDVGRVGPDRLLETLEANGFYDKTCARRKKTAADAVSSAAGERLVRAIVGWLVGKTLEANGLGLLAVLI
jgi:hypothetical protein